MNVEIIERGKPIPELEATMRAQEAELMRRLGDLDPMNAGDSEAILVCVALLELRCCVKVALPDAPDLAQDAHARVERASEGAEKERLAGTRWDS